MPNYFNSRSLSLLILQGSLLQLYAVQCSSDIANSTAHALLVESQCKAVPLNCSEPSPIAQGLTIRDVLAAVVPFPTETVMVSSQRGFQRYLLQIASKIFTTYW